MLSGIIGLCLIVAVTSASISEDDKKLFNNGHNIFAYEQGQIVHEVIATDLKNGLVLIKMPRHNGLDAMEIMTDYKNGWTLKKFLEKNTCHLAELDKSQFTEPELLEETFISETKLETKVWENVPNITNSYVVVGEITDKSFLHDKMATLCDGLPIYRTELVGKRPGIAEQYDNGITIYPSFYTHSRRKRQLGEIIIDDCSEKNTKSACVLVNRYCHYIATCERIKDKVTNWDTSACKRSHEYGTAKCCTSCCADKATASKISPYCKSVKIEDLKCYNKDTKKWISQG